jgi:hypothetical protein
MKHILSTALIVCLTLAATLLARFWAVPNWTFFPLGVAVALIATLKFTQTDPLGFGLAGIIVHLIASAPAFSDRTILGQAYNRNR